MSDYLMTKSITISTRNVRKYHKRITLSCTTYYLPWTISDPDYPSSCTSSVLVNPLRRSCTYKKFGQADGQTGWFLYNPLICGDIPINKTKRSSSEHNEQLGIIIIKSIISREQLHENVYVYWCNVGYSVTLLNHTTLDSDKNVTVRGIFNNKGYFC